MEEIEERIYPSLQTYKEQSPEFNDSLSHERMSRERMSRERMFLDLSTDDQIIKTIKDLRVSEFVNEKQKLVELLSHYTKIKKRWTKIDSCLKIIGISLGSIGILSTTIVGIIPTFVYSPILIGGVMGTFSTIDLFLTETISIGITSKRKKIYREICEKLELGINKLYLFQVKALSDDALTNQEIEESINIVNEIKDNILKIKQKDLPTFQESEKSKLKEKLVVIKKEYAKQTKEYKEKVNTLK